MYESLRSWCKQELTVVRHGGYEPSGERKEDERFTVKGLLVDDSKMFTDKNGNLATCRCYCYIIPEPAVIESDRIILPGATVERQYEIRKLGGYYDGNTGSLDVQVVYL